MTDKLIHMPDGAGGTRPAPYLCSTSEALKFLQQHTIQTIGKESTLQRLRRMGKLRAVRVGKSIFFPLKELCEYIDRETEAQNPPKPDGKMSRAIGFANVGLEALEHGDISAVKLCLESVISTLEFRPSRGKVTEDEG